RKLWETKNGDSYYNSYGNGTRGTPTVDGGRRFALGPGGHMVCLDSTTERVIWRQDLVRDFRSRGPAWGFSEPPHARDQRMLAKAGGPDATVVALDKTNGAMLWRTEEDDPAAYSSSVLAKVGAATQAVFFTEERALGVDVQSGRLLWSYDRAN